MNIYVGNLSYEVTEEELKELFEAFGQVSTSSVVKDKFSGQSKGFGFVEMPTEAEAKAAIGGLNGKDLKGRAISVDEARPRAGGGGGGARGGDRGRGGGSRGGDWGGSGGSGGSGGRRSRY